MVHLRLIVPEHLAALVVARLNATDCVAHVVQFRTTSSTPEGAVMYCDVVREGADGVIEWLRSLGVHHSGAIVIEDLAAAVSDAADRAADRTPGEASDALVWDELESRARDDAVLSVSYLVFISIAAIIAAVGILLDSSVLVVGAMVVGPEYGPLAALCVASVRRRRHIVRHALTTLTVGLVAAAIAAFIATLLFRATGLTPGAYDLNRRQLTSFISHPDGMAAVVAVLAGVAGMLSLTEARAGALIGVLVSVTTIPAAANVGLGTAYGQWTEVRGASLQLLVNIAGLAVAGVATLVVQARLTGVDVRGSYDPAEITASLREG